MTSSFLMRYLAIAACTILTVVPAEAQTNETSGVEAAIRAVAQEFTAAFDRGDAEAIAQLFTADAVFTDNTGQRFKGRDAIQQQYATLFASRSGSRMHLEIDSIRTVGATTAIEEGRVAVTPQPPGAPRMMSHYTAVHTLQDDQWRIAHVCDTMVELPPDHGQLEDFDFLVGTWVAAGEDASVEVKLRWIEDRHYLARTHTTTESGKVTSTGIQIIGVDPSTEQITSWSFTNDGGRAVGVWSPTEKGWSVQSTGVLSDGTMTFANDLLSSRDDDTIVWQSVNRTVDGVDLPDTEQVALKRQ